MKAFITLLLLSINILISNGEKLMYKRSSTNFNQAVIYKNEVPTDFSIIANDALNQRKRVSLTRTTVDIKHNLNNKPKFLKAMTTDPFLFSIQCSTLNCNEYQDKIQQGSEYIAKAFEFYEVVKVNVTIFPFCNYVEDKDRCSSIMGITYPPTFIPLAEKDSPENTFLYPQALVKQLDLDGSLQMDSEYDFTIYLNGDYTPSEERDNRALIATHEIIHGLGFFHLMAPISGYISNIETLFDDDFVLPPLNNERKVYGNSAKHIYDGFTPFSIFDKFIVGTANPKEYLYKNLLNFYKDEFYFILDEEEPLQSEVENLVKACKSLAKDKDSIRAGVDINKKFITLNAVGFRTDSGDVIELQTFDGVYESASSISHVNAPFPCTSSSQCDSSGFDLNMGEDYLMFFGIFLSQSTDAVMKAYSSKSKYGIIGPDLMKIMTTLGWTEKNTAREKTKYVVNNSDDIYTNTKSSSGVSRKNDDQSGVMEGSVTTFVILFSLFYSILCYVIF